MSKKIAVGTRVLRVAPPRTWGTITAVLPNNRFHIRLLGEEQLISRHHVLTKEECEGTLAGTLG
jgi:hypothetical protein